MIRQMNNNEVSALRYELLLKDILATAEKLPPFPDVVWKVMGLIKKTAPVSEIEAVIKYDPVIASRILALSQSAFYGRRFEVSSLKDAILVLGDQKLMQVLMTACTMRYFQGNKGRADSSERQLWEHSVATAIMGELVSRVLKQNKLLTTFTAGLLHDIGKIVLDLYAKLYLGTSLQEINQKGMQPISAERRALGIDHQELGKLIARRWRFPEETIAAIGHHHSPGSAPTGQDVATTIYVANRIVATTEGRIEATEPFDPKRDAVFTKLGITSGIIEALQVKLSESLGGVKELLLGK